MNDIVAVAINKYGAWVISVVAALAAVWNRFGIKSLQIKTDGMLEIRSRADRAEATVDEKNKADDRADKKENAKNV